MACAEYKERLIEAALDWESEAVHEVRFVGHMETCAACRVELDRQRALYEHIEDGVAALVGVQAPAAIAARVRQQIALEKASFTIRNFGWLSAAAVAAIAVALAFVMRMPHRSPANNNATAAIPSSRVATAPTSGTHSVDTQRATTRTPDVAAQIAHAVTRVQQPELIDEAVTATIGPPRVQVMVPPGQREAVLRLAAALQTGRVDAASLIKSPESFQPAELKIAPLEIKPLVPDENDAGSNPPDTKPLIRN